MIVQQPGDPRRPDRRSHLRVLLERVRETSLENYAYQEPRSSGLVQELRPERQLGRNPLFQVMFNFHDAAIPDLDFGGLSGWFLVRATGRPRWT